MNCKFIQIVALVALPLGCASENMSGSAVESALECRVWVETLKELGCVGDAGALDAAVLCAEGVFRADETSVEAAEALLAEQVASINCEALELATSAQLTVVDERNQSGPIEDEASEASEPEASAPPTVTDESDQFVPIEDEISDVGGCWLVRYPSPLYFTCVCGSYDYDRFEDRAVFQLYLAPLDYCF